MQCVIKTRQPPFKGCFSGARAGAGSVLLGEKREGTLSTAPPGRTTWSPGSEEQPAPRRRQEHRDEGGERKKRGQKGEKVSRADVHNLDSCKRGLPGEGGRGQKAGRGDEPTPQQTRPMKSKGERTKSTGLKTASAGESVGKIGRSARSIYRAGVEAAFTACVC